MLEGIRFRLRLTLIIVFIAAVLFEGVRLLFFISYHNVFSDLTFWQKIMAFLDGLRFDLSIFFTFCGFFILLINLPVSRKWWFKLWSFIILFELFIIAYVLVGDYTFFDYVKRHTGSEIFNVLTDFGFIVRYIRSKYFIAFIFSFFVFFFVVALVNSFINRKFSGKRSGFVAEVFYVLFLVVVIIFAIRGRLSLSGKPINIVNAYRYPKSSYGNLVLNGVFTAYHTLRNTKRINHNFFSYNEALKVARGWIVTEDETLVDENYPLMRVRKRFNVNAEKFNVVIILLEGWSAKYVDFFSGNGYGVTPNFDRLASEGLAFMNFYATGVRSAEGIGAVLLGVPTLPGMPYLGRGLEISNVMRIGDILKKAGYHTIFVQTSKRGSLRVENIAYALGFDEFYGMEDIPVIGNYTVSEKPPFGYDYDALMFLKNRLDKMKKPFFAFLFTGTTHPPYVLPDPRFQKYPHKKNSLEGFLNTLYYADHAIGEFIKAARKSRWFNNTVFIFTADHTVLTTGNFVKEKYGIPLVIYCPSLFKPQKIYFTASHLDIVPTLFDILNIKLPYSAVGKSLLGKYDKRFALFVDGFAIGIVTDGGFLKHSYAKRLEYGSFGKAFDPGKMEKVLLSIDQTIYDLLARNRWYKGD